MEHTSSESLASALKLLDETAKHKKDELLTVLSDKYTDLREAIMANEGSYLKTVVAARDQAVGAAADVRKATVEKAREITRDVGQSVHRDPWPYVAGAAVVGLLLGHILSRRHE